MPRGEPRGTNPQESKEWFEKAFVTHVWEKHSGAHLIDDGSLKRCSICKYPFPPDVEPSVDRAFTDHLLRAHKPGQTSEDFSQAAVRVVREATDR